MQTASKPRPRIYAVSRTNRPRCPEHGKLLRCESSIGTVGYCYCPEANCRHSAKVLRTKIQRVG